MRPLTKFGIRLVASGVGAALLVHFFKFLGGGLGIWLVLTFLILFMAYGLEALRDVRFRR